MTTQTTSTNIAINIEPFQTAESRREEPSRYARCIEASKSVRWDIEQDVIRGRSFDLSQKFLPDGLSLVSQLGFLTEAEQRYLSQIQGRTYCNIFHMAERFVNAKVLEVSQDHRFGDQTALEALIRFSDEELKHQEMFRRLEQLADSQMAPGYTFVPDANEVAQVVLEKGTWAVLALTLHIEVVVLVHYRQSIGVEKGLSPLFKDVFRYHWMEESQHAIMDELEWDRCNRQTSWEGRDRGVNEFIELVGAVDGILQMQSQADAEYFARTCGRVLTVDQWRPVEALILKAYRWQHIIMGAQQPHFNKVLTSFVTEEQYHRIEQALASIS